MSYYYLHVKDLQNNWTMVYIDDDDDEWDQRSMPSKAIGSGSGDCRRIHQLVSLFDGDSGAKILQLHLGSGQRFRRGEKGSGMAGGATPTLKDGPVEWECTAFYDD